MAAVTLVGKTTATGSGGSVTVAFPAGVRGGDIAVLIFGSQVTEAAPTPTPDPGGLWSFLTVRTNRHTITGTLAAYGLYCLGTEDGTSVTVNSPVGFTMNDVVAALIVLRGDFQGAYADGVNVCATPTVASLFPTPGAALTIGGVADVPPDAYIISAGLAILATTTLQTCAVTGTAWTEVDDFRVVGGTYDVYLDVATNTTSTGTAPDATFTWSTNMLEIEAIEIAVFNTDHTPRRQSQWNPYEQDAPNDHTKQQMQQLRYNLFAISLDICDQLHPDTARAPMGWGYTTSVTRGEASPGTDAHPNRRYWFRGGGEAKRWVKQDVTYTGTDATKVALYYSDDNEATYVPMTDSDGNYVQTITYGASHEITSITWGNTP